MNHAYIEKNYVCNNKIHNARKFNKNNKMVYIFDMIENSFKCIYFDKIIDIKIIDTFK